MLWIKTIPPIPTSSLDSEDIELQTQGQGDVRNTNPPNRANPKAIYAVQLVGVVSSLLSNGQPQNDTIFYYFLSCCASLHLGEYGRES
jgi:hypothetical protein